ncbi:FliH/SctL family protein [Komagataeibacter kakiaceti]|uniref:hypothetical protein n=1 Tax=Komagataeibacter kakiaceti TaxID=943261 RepID=UPI000AD0F8E2|nr:hypothetical protein [Komagataeibacter kakiaceti]
MPIRDLADIEDFGVVPMTVADNLAAKEEAQPETPEPDPNLITMTREEADAIRKAAFHAGFEKGQQDREQALQEHYAGCVSSLTDIFKAENDRRNQVMMAAAKAFLMTVVDIVRTLTALDGSVVAGMQRDLILDAVAFVKECDGPVKVQCNSADAQRLTTLLRGNPAVRIEATKGSAEDAIRITSAANTIVIDPGQWRKAVAEKIVAAVTASRSSGGGGTCRKHRPGGENHEHRQRGYRA